MYHDVVELSEIVDMPVIVHGLVLAQIVFNQVNLYTKEKIVTYDSGIVKGGK